MKTMKLIFACLCVVLMCGALPAQADDIAFAKSGICGLDLPRPDRDAALRQQVVPGRNGPIAYYRFGRGTPVVLITGYRASIAEWDAFFLGELAQHHEVIVFDNRGVGGSSALPGRYGVEYGMRDMADDAADVISHLGLRRVTVVGWSMGGMIAQQLALGPASARLGRLVLISTAAPGAQGVPLRREVGEVLSSHGPDAFARIMGVLFPPDAVEDAKRCFGGDMFRPPGYRATPVSDDVSAQQNRAIQRWFANDDAARALGKLAVPTLVVTGAQDDVLSVENSRTLARIIAHARLAIVADAGHALMFQYPVELGKMVSEFAPR